MKTYLTYDVDYDGPIFLDLITEDKLNDYIEYYISKKLLNSKVKFEVKNIDIIGNDYISINTFDDAYEVTYNGNTQKFPARPGHISFYLHEINKEKINSFIA